MMDHYPYHDGILKTYAVVAIGQKPRKSKKDIDIMDPVGLVLHTWYYDNFQDALDKYAEINLRCARLYNTKGTLAFVNWHQIKP